MAKGDGGKEARAERDKGMARVKRKSEPWYTYAIMVVVNLPNGWKGIAEDYNNLIREKVGPPKNYGIHHNIFGSLTTTLVTMGLIEHTGEYRQMKNKKSHARSHAPVYVRTRYHPPKLVPSPTLPTKPLDQPFAALRP